MCHYIVTIIFIYSAQDIHAPIYIYIYIYDIMPWVDYATHCPVATNPCSHYTPSITPSRRVFSLHTVYHPITTSVLITHRLSPHHVFSLHTVYHPITTSVLITHRLSPHHDECSHYTPSITPRPVLCSSFAVI